MKVQISDDKIEVTKEQQYYERRSCDKEEGRELGSKVIGRRAKRNETTTIKE